MRNYFLQAISQWHPCYRRRCHGLALKLSALISLLLISTQLQAQLAQQLYSAYQDSVFQIRLIELSSGSKGSIGSGFQISADGLIATNYHVVAGAVYHPDKYRLEYVDHQGKLGELQILAIDVVHDLALVQHAERSKSHFLQLSNRDVQQGEDIFSMGNPRDLGMTVVSGTYNGILERSYHERILFSGSINPGMSGGPALNVYGEVIGINVATAGNQLSFLVPVAELSRLLAEYQQKRASVSADGVTPLLALSPSSNDFKADIAVQLQQNQALQMQSLLDSKWPTVEMGDVRVAGEMTRFMSCWGGSNNNDQKALYEVVYNTCFSEDRIYLADDFSTGLFNYEFYWLSTDKLNPWQFYSRYQNSLSGAVAVNQASEEHVTEFRCYSDFVAFGMLADDSDSDEHSVAPGPENWKATLCAREYKDYPDLYDLMYIAAWLDSNDKGLVSHFALAGVERSLGMEFLRKFVRHIAWK